MINRSSPERTSVRARRVCRSSSSRITSVCTPQEPRQIGLGLLHESSAFNSSHLQIGEPAARWMPLRFTRFHHIGFMSMTTPTELVVSHTNSDAVTIVPFRDGMYVNRPHRCNEYNV